MKSRNEAVGFSTIVDCILFFLILFYDFEKNRKMVDKGKLLCGIMVRISKRQHMLLYFKTKNHRSIKDEVFLDMELPLLKDISAATPFDLVTEYLPIHLRKMVAEN